MINDEEYNADGLLDLQIHHRHSGKALSLQNGMPLRSGGLAETYRFCWHIVGNEPQCTGNDSHVRHDARREVEIYIDFIAAFP